jgi:hypothetical protein
MKQFPSWVASSCSARQEIPRPLRNLMMHYRVHKTPIMVPVTPVPLCSYFFRIRLNTIILSMSAQSSSRFSGQTFVCISRISYACYPILVLFTLIMISGVLKNVNPEYVTRFTQLDTSLLLHLALWTSESCCELKLSVPDDDSDVILEKWTC